MCTGTNKKKCTFACENINNMAQTKRPQVNALGIKMPYTTRMEPTDIIWESHPFLLLVHLSVPYVDFFNILHTKTGCMFSMYKDKPKCNGRYSYLMDFATYVYWPDNAIYADRPMLTLCKVNNNKQGKCLVGNTDAAVYKMAKLSRKNLQKDGVMVNQAMLSFDEDFEEQKVADSATSHEDFQQLQWQHFTRKMEQHSIHLMGNVDLLFYCDIANYRCMENFYLSLSRTGILSYQLLYLNTLQNGGTLFLDWQTRIYEIVMGQFHALPGYSKSNIESLYSKK